MGNTQGKPVSYNDAGKFIWHWISVGMGGSVLDYLATAEELLLEYPLIAFLLLVNLNHFRLLRVVGKGAFGKVRIVERKDTGLTFALKYIRKEEGLWELQNFR